MPTPKHIIDLATSLNPTDRAQLRAHLLDAYDIAGERKIQKIDFRRVHAKYYASSDGWRFYYTAKSCTDDKGAKRFACYTRKPIGRGARNGTAHSWDEPTDVSYRAKRKDAERLAILRTAERDLTLAKRAHLTRESLALTHIVDALRAGKPYSAPWPKL